MELRFQNKNDYEYEKLFNELIINVFGFSFSKWHELQLWDSQYESYSIIDNGKMLSNVCLYKTELLINSKETIAYQLGAVATHTDYRNQGLSSKIINYIIDKYTDVPMFLFANESVLDFYPKYGFKRIYDSLSTISQRIDNPDILARKLNLADPLLKSFLYNGRSLSKQIDCKNTQSVAYFHFLMEYGDNIFYLADIDTLIVASQEGSSLFVPYINAPKGIDFNMICRLLPFSCVNHVSFGFTPDNLAIDYTYEKLTSPNESMFVKGNIELPQSFTFPVLSKT